MPARRSLRSVCALSIVAVLLAGCGAFGQDDDEARAARRTSEAAVVEIREGTSAGELIVVVEIPAGQKGCAIEPRATVTGDENTVYLQAIVDTTVEDGVGVCAERAQAEVVVEVPPIGDRRLLVNNFDTWARTEDGTYRQCLPPFGCDAPPADRCAPAWIDHALLDVDVEPERSVRTTACDGNWLVLDIDAVVTGCQPVDGQAPPEGCAGSGTHTRWFLMFVDEQSGWDVVASGTQAGCADVHPTAPEFPASLCQGLPAR